MDVRPGALGLLLALVVTGCAGRTEAPGQRLVQPGAPGEPTRVVGTDAISAPLPHTAADVRFMQRMMLHHVQALVMSAMVSERTRNNEIRLLARRTEVSQNDEMALMRSWLEDRGEAVPPIGEGDHHHHSDEPMPGMLTPDELARLEAARGAEFDRLFLLSMIRHHQGALVMVGELFNSPGAVQEEEIFQFASHVEADQRIEIARMERMLGAMSR